MESLMVQMGLNNQQTLFQQLEMLYNGYIGLDAKLVTYTSLIQLYMCSFLVFVCIICVYTVQVYVCIQCITLYIFLYSKPSKVSERLQVRANEGCLYVISPHCCHRILHMICFRSSFLQFGWLYSLWSFSMLLETRYIWSSVKTSLTGENQSKKCKFQSTHACTLCVFCTFL